MGPMVNLTKIYTRTGDEGTTALGDFSRTSKTDSRLQAYADTNEANAVIGVAVATGGLDEDLVATLTRVQNDLFDVGADLCTPLLANPEYPPLRVKQEWIDELEADCDEYLTRVEKLRSFILPGGTAGSAWAAREEYGTEVADERGVGGVNPLTTTYLNRLSDLLFILARVANLSIGGDVLWQPGGGREDRPKKSARP